WCIPQRRGHWSIPWWMDAVATVDGTAGRCCVQNSRGRAHRRRCDVRGRRATCDRYTSTRSLPCLVCAHWLRCDVYVAACHIRTAGVGTRRRGVEDPDVPFTSFDQTRDAGGRPLARDQIAPP